MPVQHGTTLYIYIYIYYEIILQFSETHEKTCNKYEFILQILDQNNLNKYEFILNYLKRLLIKF